MNQTFTTLLVKHSCLNLQKLFHNSSYTLGNHYDTLKLQRDCSAKQIRDSFIQLSKKNHPDINKSQDAHKEFVKIQEAYNVLSKPNARAQYDLSLSYPGRQEASRYGSRGPWATTHGRDPWADPSFYHNRDRSQDTHNASHSYYGIKGINRVSNGSIALVIVAVFSALFLVQMISIRYAMLRQLDSTNQRNRATQRLLNDLKEQAQKNSPEAQIESLRQHFEEMDQLRPKRTE